MSVGAALAWRGEPGWLLVLAFTGFALGPLAAPGFVGSHDGLLAVSRLFELERSLAGGAFPPRWSPDAFFGYGYPFFNFYAPLAYQLAAIFHRLGADLATAVELTFAFGFLASALGGYLLGRCWLSTWGALVAAVAYVYFPYHLVDAHFRGDLSEFLAMAWLPWILWTLVRLRRPTWGRITAFALAYAALILSHNVLALAFSPVVLVFGALQVMQGAFAARRTSPRPTEDRGAGCVLLAFAAGVVLAYGLAAHFWVPALAEKETVQIEHTVDDPSVDFRNHFPRDLLSRSLRQPYGSWESGEYRYAVQAGLLQIGLALAGLAAGLGQLVRRRLPTDAAIHLLGFAALAALFWALMQPFSTPLWAELPLMVYVQFPWRMLAPFGLATAMLAGFLPGFLAEFLSKFLPGFFARFLAPGSNLHADFRLQASGSLLLCIAIVVFSLWRLEPRFMALPADWPTLPGQVRFELATQAIGTTSIGEYLPRAVRIRPATSPLAQAIVLGEPAAWVVPAPGSRILVETVAESAGRVAAIVDGDGGWVAVRIPDWPGWRAMLDGRPAAISPLGQLGLVGVEVPPGRHRLEVALGTTPVRQLAELASALSLTVLVGGCIASALGRTKFLVSGFWFLVAALPTRNPRPETRNPIPFLAACVAALAVVYTLWLGRVAGNPAGAQQPMLVTLGDAVDLLGYDLAVEPDRAIDLTLYWQARRPLALDYHTFVHLAGITGQVWAQGDRQAGPPDRPASRWAAGAVVADRYRFRPPAGTPAGVYLLRLGLYRPDTQERLPITAERLAGPTFSDRIVTAGPLVLPRGAESVSPQASVEARFEDLARIVGFSFAPPGATVAPPEPGPLRLRPGTVLPVTLYWQAIQPIFEDYTVFVHLLDERQQVVAQQDNQPALGASPTSAWLPGETVADPYVLKLPSDVPPGRYEIEIGLYRSADGRRLGVDDGSGRRAEDRLVLRDVIVE
ncbi:MAG: hypothetical protein HY331_09465 [Chloroflexi bacterium]|nr:hypothetical protein [Chloroflexota bacterium]